MGYLMIYLELLENKMGDVEKIISVIVYAFLSFYFNENVFKQWRTEVGMEKGSDS